MDLLANLFNTDAPALLDTARRGLLPLMRQGRRGPAVDLDAFLLVALAEFASGKHAALPCAALLVWFGMHVAVCCRAAHASEPSPAALPLLCRPVPGGSAGCTAQADGRQAGGRASPRTQHRRAPQPGRLSLSRCSSHSGRPLLAGGHCTAGCGSAQAAAAQRYAPAHSKPHGDSWATGGGAACGVLAQPFAAAAWDCWGGGRRGGPRRGGCGGNGAQLASRLSLVAGRPGSRWWRHISRGAARHAGAGLQPKAAVGSAQPAARVRPQQPTLSWLVAPTAHCCSCPSVLLKCVGSPFLLFWCCYRICQTRGACLAISITQNRRPCQLAPSHPPRP